MAVNWGGTKVVGVYSSPNGTMTNLEHLLGEVGALIHGCPTSPTIVMGDLNAKSVGWGSPVTHARGRAVWKWVVEIGLLVLNRG